MNENESLAKINEIVREAAAKITDVIKKLAKWVREVYEKLEEFFKKVKKKQKTEQSSPKKYGEKLQTKNFKHERTYATLPKHKINVYSKKNEPYQRRNYTK